MDLRKKIIPFSGLTAWRSAFSTAERLVVTNGCFDLIHAGHVLYLSQARALGDFLLVGLNGDDSVRQLKGDQRPLNPEDDRALVLAGLEAVGAVCIFPEKSATAFLRLARPQIYVKGGDYTVDQLNPEERSVVEQAGGRIEIIPFLPGRSTSRILHKIQALAN